MLQLTYYEYRDLREPWSVRIVQNLAISRQVFVARRNVAASAVHSFHLKHAAKPMHSGHLSVRTSCSTPITMPCIGCKIMQVHVF